MWNVFMVFVGCFWCLCNKFRFVNGSICKCEARLYNEDAKNMAKHANITTEVGFLWINHVRVCIGYQSICLNIFHKIKFFHNKMALLSSNWDSSGLYKGISKQFIRICGFNWTAFYSLNVFVASLHVKAIFSIFYWFSIRILFFTWPMYSKICTCDILNMVRDSTHLPFI